MEILISNSGQEPIYAQITRQIEQQILSGTLRQGDALPSIRLLAKELRISVITVKKAWEELERQGLIVSITGKGCFVAEIHDGELDDRRVDMALKRLGQEVAYCKSLGLDETAITNIVHQCFHRP